MVPRQLTPYDKLVHFSMYGVFAALLTQYLMIGRGWWRAALLSAVFVVAFGAADEWHQRFIPGRSTEFADWMADSVGAIIGVTAVSAFSRRLTRLSEAR